MIDSPMIRSSSKNRKRRGKMMTSFPSIRPDEFLLRANPINVIAKTISRFNEGPSLSERIFVVFSTAVLMVPTALLINTLPLTLAIKAVVLVSCMFSISACASFLGGCAQKSVKVFNEYNTEVLKKQN